MSISSEATLLVRIIRIMESNYVACTDEVCLYRQLWVHPKGRPRGYPYVGGWGPGVVKGITPPKYRIEIRGLLKAEDCGERSD